MNAPRMKFNVLRSFQNALSRLTTEAVFINAFGTMNSKCEFRNNALSKIIAVDPRKRKKIADADEEEELLMRKIDEIRKVRDEGAMTTSREKDRVGFS